MGRIIAIANQKGGVGKTTTAINLAACLAESGKKILAIDLDPQGNMTSGLGVDKNEIENTVYELMLDECTINESMQKTVVDNLKIIASNVNLAGAEIELLGINDKEYILKTAVDYIKDDYDFIIIDCPPSLNMLTVNAMTTADTVLVPIQCEYYALEGLSQLIHTINLVQERLNPNGTIGENIPRARCPDVVAQSRTDVGERRNGQTEGIEHGQAEEHHCRRAQQHEDGIDEQIGHDAVEHGVFYCLAVQTNGDDGTRMEDVEEFFLDDFPEEYESHHLDAAARGARTAAADADEDYHHPADGGPEHEVVLAESRGSLDADGMEEGVAEARLARLAERNQAGE